MNQMHLINVPHRELITVAYADLDGTHAKEKFVAAYSKLEHFRLTHFHDARRDRPVSRLSVHEIVERCSLDDRVEEHLRISLGGETEMQKVRYNPMYNYNNWTPHRNPTGKPGMLFTRPLSANTYEYTHADGEWLRESLLQRCAHNHYKMTSSNWTGPEREGFIKKLNALFSDLHINPSVFDGGASTKAAYSLYLEETSIKLAELIADHNSKAIGGKR